MYMVSRSAGCQYCAVHSASLASLRDVSTRKIEALEQFEQSPEFSDAERAALRFAQAAGKVPNAVGDVEFAELRRHFDEEQILEMVAVLALLGFLNRWNDTLATTLEAGRGPAERPSFPLATQVLAAETAIEIRFTAGEDIMSDIAYVSRVRIERKVGAAAYCLFAGRIAGRDP